MVTADEIGSIGIFAGLSDADRERLARAAADITLAPGEYAAHEGGDRALFAVLGGTIEAVKLVDGIPRVVGERQVGDLFGEVPIALGTGFEAYVPRTRVVRQEAAMAMVNGLGSDSALKAITLDAAKLLRIGDRFGSSDIFFGFYFTGRHRVLWQNIQFFITSRNNRDSRYN